jgi:RNA polymerase sigma-70 factor (ECF subfamily)
VTSGDARDEAQAVPGTASAAPDAGPRGSAADPGSAANPLPDTHPGPSDAELLRAHVEGDPRAFGELVRRHRDRLWAVAIRTIGDREEAADAVQDALLSAHRAAARFRGDSAVTTWLHRIVVNACLDRMRRRQAHPTVPLPDGSHSDDGPHRGPEPAAPMLDHDTALVVRQALAALPIEQRAALVLVDVQGYPVLEAAEILGVAEGTIKSRCARGRARMAISLGHLRRGSDEPSRDAGHAGAGNRAAAGSVSSGSAAAVSPPSTPERRDQR